MNAVQMKTLRDSGFSEAAIIVIEEITEIKTKDLVTKKDLEVTKLELEYQIKQVKLELKKQIKQVKLELQKEIEEVKLAIQQVKVEVYKVANTQLWKFAGVLITFLSPLYAIVIKALL